MSTFIVGLLSALIPLEDVGGAGVAVKYDDRAPGLIRLSLAEKT